MKEQSEKSDLTIAAQPNNINQRHRALMRKLISGMTLTQACDDLGFSISRASIIVNSPLFQEEMKALQTQVNSNFAELEAEKQSVKTDVVKSSLSESAEMAARTLKGALSDDNPAIRVSAARDILDRTGYAKEDKVRARIEVEPSPALVGVLTRMMRENDNGKNDKQSARSDEVDVTE